MKRGEFLKRLLDGLSFMTEGERRSVQEYYEEMLDDALEEGGREEEALAGFGAPEEIAQRMAAEYVPPAQAAEKAAGNTAARQDVKLISIFTAAATVQLSEAGVEKPQVTWENMDEWDTIDVTEENGVLRVQHSRKAPLRIGALFTVINRRIQLDVPYAYAGSAQIEVKNGAIRLEGMKHLAQVGCNAHNGAVRAAGCAACALAIEARNGAVKLTACEAQALAVQAYNGAVCLEACTGGSVKVQGRNGAVRLTDCDFAQLLELGNQNGAMQVQGAGPADCIRLSNKNGSVTAGVNGKEDDYSIDIHTVNGRCTPPACVRPRAGKTLYAHTVNGKVDIRFHG